jgi:hypothetical protein
LVIMAKLPVAGSVKTRLAREIGTVRATWFYRHAAAAVIARMARSRIWETVLAITPDSSVAHPTWPRGLTRMGQGRGDLGRRMQRAIRLQPPGPVVIIGTDVPGIRPSDVAAAFKSLGSHDAVFGPASDGGYWLVGLRRRPREIAMFKDVRWSSPHALQDTLRNLRCYRIGFVAEKSDVDDAADLRRVTTCFGRRVLPALADELTSPKNL